MEGIFPNSRMSNDGILAEDKSGIAKDEPRLPHPELCACEGRTVAAAGRVLATAGCCSAVTCGVFCPLIPIRYIYHLYEPFTDKKKIAI